MPDEDQRGQFQHVLPSGRNVALGRPRASIYDDPRTHNTFRFARYVDRRKLGEPPDYVDNTEGVQPIMGHNDSLGDCTVVAKANYSILSCAIIGKRSDVNDDDCVTEYERLGGYDPATGANDNGLVEVDVLDDWRATPFKGVELAAYATIDVHDLGLIRHAIKLSGAVYAGVDLPTTAQAQEGTDWDVVQGTIPGSWGGHAIILPKCDFRSSVHRLWCYTWAELQSLTEAFWRACFDEVYAPIPQTWIENPPPGFNAQLLLDDLKALGPVSIPRRRRSR